MIWIIEKLVNQVEQLSKELEKYKHPKNSSNSFVPPSKDKNKPKRNESLRQKSGRKVGGQKGHCGTTLQMIEMPDEIIGLVPKYCNKCGADLKGREVILDIFIDKTKTPKTLVFQNAMKTIKQSIFQFLYRKEVLPR